MFAASNEASTPTDVEVLEEVVGRNKGEVGVEVLTVVVSTVVVVVSCVGRCSEVIIYLIGQNFGGQNFRHQLEFSAAENVLSISNFIMSLTLF